MVSDIRLGSRADSYYEYLLYGWILRIQLIKLTAVV